MANEDKFAKTIDDDELDQVAGGTWEESQRDILFLNYVGSEKGIKLKSTASSEEIDAAWEKFGIMSETDDRNSVKNEYIKMNFDKDGFSHQSKFISRQDAMIHAMRRTKRVVDLDEYN